MSSCTLDSEALGEGEGVLDGVEVTVGVDVWLAGYDTVSKLQECTRLFMSTMTESQLIVHYGMVDL